MIAHSDKSLQHYAHKTLLQRLLIMTLAITLVVSVMVYVLETQRMQEYVVEQATTAVSLIVAHARNIKDEKGIDRYLAFRQAFAERVATPEQRQSGDFFYAGFYTPAGGLIDEYIETEIMDGKKLKSHFVSQPLIQPAIDSYHVQSEGFDDQPYVYVVFPIVDLQQQVAAYTHAVFALSVATQAQMQNTLWRAVITTILIILATSLLLYPVILRLVKRLSRFSADLLDANLQSISLLGGTIAKRDSDTDAHNYRVSIYAVRLAEAIGLDVETIRGLIKGAFLHDVGKIGIRDNVLLKPGKLDEREFEVMKTHVEHGLDIVDRSAWLTDAKDVVGGHHEKYAGGGYPKGLREQAIPITARIFAIADVFDALTSKRPYKEPMSFDKTMAIMQEGSENHFDPELLAAFVKIAPQLYQKYCGREDAGLHEELEAILRHYFTTDVRSLMTW
jgi:HD-GYP domain-containing protein (c-di-GMP phosphodiesterase class II)